MGLALASVFNENELSFSSTLYNKFHYLFTQRTLGISRLIFKGEALQLSSFNTSLLVKAALPFSPTDGDAASPLLETIRLLLTFKIKL